MKAFHSLPLWLPSAFSTLWLRHRKPQQGPKIDLQMLINTKSKQQESFTTYFVFKLDVAAFLGYVTAV